MCDGIEMEEFPVAAPSAVSLVFIISSALSLVTHCGPLINTDQTQHGSVPITSDHLGTPSRKDSRLIIRAHVHLHALALLRT